MKLFFHCLLFVALFSIPQSASAEPSPSPSASPTLSGRWRVTFTFPGAAERKLVFNSEPNGSGSFLILDPGSNNKPGTVPLPAIWSETSFHQISISGEVELPIGTCCWDTGTLMFKGKVGSSNSISGKAVFITGTIDEENFNGFRSMTGSFVATQMPRG